MLKFKRCLSLVLTVAVAASMLLVPVEVSAAVQTTTVVDTDFEDYSDEFVWDDMTTVDNGIRVVASGESEIGNVLAIGTDSSINEAHGISKKIDVKTGKVIVSAGCIRRRKSVASVQSKRCFGK